MQCHYSLWVASKLRSPTALPIVRPSVLLACGLLVLSGCTSYGAVSLDGGAGLADTVLPGDKVRVWTLSGDILEFEVTNVEDEVLIGQDQRVARRDIDFVEIQKFNKRSLYIALGAVAGALLALKIIDDNECEPSPAFLVCAEDFGGFQLARESVKR